ncbi:hypothetical protein Voc01_103650 [Virgisporangium ochraceum]|uniref:Na(+)/H(+) antiporter NhaA n=1 Tax=Virgisporangium ochraceum TaxID=65505 RepID=A0A8J4EI69_9ACTN|nr:hypothetical protein Voc01_103650 [Virgisporangium ochraceum]
MATSTRVWTVGVAAVVRRISEGGQLPRTDRTLSLDYRIRSVLATETRGAAALLAATVLALIWANIPGAGYEALWHTKVTVGVGGARLSEDLRHWVNDGLMVFFFFLAGLEIRREFSFGALRDRRAAMAPMVAAVGGMVLPAVIFATVTAGSPAQSAWGMAMATDIAFALGVLALIGPRCPANVRVFLLTLAIVDDIGAILVIAVVYTDALHLVPLLVAAVTFGVVLALRAAGIWRATPYFIAGLVLWVATYESGLHPTIVGVVLGLLTPTFLPRTGDLDRLDRLVGGMRNRPGPEKARLLAIAAHASVSSNDRLQYLLRPWSSFVIVPLFALANAGVALNLDLLSRAVRSPVTLGVFAGLVVGKALGIWGATALVVRTGFGRLPAGVAMPQIRSVGAVAGIGFTVSLFVAELALPDDAVRDEAKVGILAAAVAAVLLGVAAVPTARPATRPGARHVVAACHRWPRRAQPRAGRRGCRAGAVRRLPVPVLPPGNGRSGRAHRPARAPSALRVASPAARRDSPLRAAGRPRRRSSRPSGCLLGDAPASPRR